MREQVLTVLQKAEIGLFSQLKLKLPDMLSDYYQNYAKTRFGLEFVEDKNGFEQVVQGLVSKVADDANILLD